MRNGDHSSLDSRPICQYGTGTFLENGNTKLSAVLEIDMPLSQRNDAENLDFIRMKLISGLFIIKR